MVTCPACSTDNSPQSKFCSACGDALKPEYEATIAHSAHGDHPARTSGRTESTPSDSSHHGRFLPGAQFAGRYRIVSLLGKGGMGEVYRADDLKLGQSVALKFLSGDLADDSRRHEFFHSEVRLSRQISHPNVCRVYDIGEVDGQHFLSMEYIDGEDLKCLLRRIGRLPKSKCVEIAQQLCAGLAAAHDRGVLHRDLKPANIMIDGRGEARITDFGLAQLADTDDGDGEVAGTPAYMAPEQLTRGRTTIQSDLYSLGLILYEISTGRPVHQAGSLQELIRAHEESSRSQPSSVVDDIDPAVERVILRCLEKEPHERPKSARAVSAALPGGDPLAAALAAGETPSPELVAAAHTRGQLSPRLAVGLLTAALLLLVGVAVLKSFGSKEIRLPEKPDALASSARKMIEGFGYRTANSDWASGFADNPRPTATIPEVSFWYRQSPQPLLVWRAIDAPFEVVESKVSFEKPEWNKPRMIGLRLSPEGKLLYFRAVPPLLKRSDADVGRAPKQHWLDLLPERFTENLTELAAGDWKVRPPDVYETIEYWQGADANSGEPFFIQVASYGGRLTYFEIISDDADGDAVLSRLPETPRFRHQPPIPDVGTGVVAEAERTRFALELARWFGVNVIIWLSAAVLGLRNWRRGRADRRSAWRLAVFVFVAMMVMWLFGYHHVLMFEEVEVVEHGVAKSLLFGAGTWLLYIAVEPFVRRFWPRTLVSWTRIMNGRLRDPLIGQDVLIGVLAGCAAALIPRLVGAPSRDSAYWTGLLVNSAGPLESVLFAVLFGIWIALMTLGFVVMLRLVFRVDWLVVVLATGVLPMSGAALFNPGSWILGMLFSAAFLWMVMRWSLLGAILFFSIPGMVELAITYDPSRWYSSVGIVQFALLAGLALYGFYTSLGGRPIFREASGKAAGPLP